MKKIILGLCAITASTGSLLCAAPYGQSNSQSMQGQGADCSQLTPDEQNFAGQLMDMNNKKMFCTQFTPQQRQQAMQMMGQTDSSGMTMNADQAVMKVMGMGAMAPSSQSKVGAGSPQKP